MRFMRSTLDGRPITCAQVQVDDFGNEFVLTSRVMRAEMEKYFDPLMVEEYTFLRVSRMTDAVDD